MSVDPHYCSIVYFIAYKIRFRWIFQALLAFFSVETDAEMGQMITALHSAAWGDYTWRVSRNIPIILYVIYDVKVGLFGVQV